jgi:dihydrofolate synthase/folylpolyglutamate synthase
LTFKEVVAELDATEKFGTNPSLNTIRKICNSLNNPQKDYFTIHVVGTNGKTSTARMISSILTHLGYKTGCYISPHIYSYIERIAIDNKYISKDNFALYYEKIKPIVNELNNSPEIEVVTHFEILTSMAFLYFSQNRCDFVVLEAGMGGRWDATNLADSKVVVLTNVTKEHTRYLGDTIYKIAVEKAEVIKNKANVVTGSSNKDVLKVLNEKCKEKDAKLYQFGKDFFIENCQRKNNQRLVYVKGIYNNYPNIKINSISKYQCENVAMAIIAAELFLERNFIKHKLIKNVMKSELLENSLLPVDFRGRLEIVSENPTIVLDGSHNPGAIKKLVSEIKENFKYEKLHLIFACFRDKDSERMLKILWPLLNNLDNLIITENKSYRRTPYEKLYRISMDVEKNMRSDSSKEYKKVKIYKKDSISKSIDLALKLANKNDIICICGSFSNLPLAKKALNIKF